MKKKKSRQHVNIIMVVFVGGDTRINSMNFIALEYLTQIRLNENELFTLCSHEKSFTRLKC